MNKLPITLSSTDFQFAIVGPIGLSDGILIQSKDATDDLIGYANLRYRTDLFDDNSEIDVQDKKVFYNIAKNYNFAWSKSLKINTSKSSKTKVDKREFKILLCFELKRSLSITNSELIISFFESKAFDIYSNLVDDSIPSFQYESIIRWLVSPIVLLGATKNN